jgi:hypothetical protein
VNPDTEKILSLPNPDPSLFVRIRILPSTRKKRKKILEYCYFLVLFDFLSLKTDANVPQKNDFLSLKTDANVPQKIKKIRAKKL